MISAQRAAKTGVSDNSRVASDTKASGQLRCTSASSMNSASKSQMILASHV